MIGGSIRKSKTPNLVPYAFYWKDCLSHPFPSFSCRYHTATTPCPCPCPYPTTTPPPPPDLDPPNASNLALPPIPSSLATLKTDSLLYGFQPPRLSAPPPPFRSPSYVSQIIHKLSHKFGLLIPPPHEEKFFWMSLWLCIDEDMLELNCSTLRSDSLLIRERS